MSRGVLGEGAAQNKLWLSFLYFARQSAGRSFPWRFCHSRIVGVSHRGSV